jgi:hypothetical protein
MAEYSLEVKIGLYTTYINIILVVTIWLNTLQKSREGFPLPTHKYNSGSHNMAEYSLEVKRGLSSTYTQL